MKRILLLFLSMLCLVGANAQVIVEQVVNSAMGSVSNSNTWTSTRTFPNAEFLSHPLTIKDQNADTTYDLDADNNGLVIVVANGHLGTARTHNITINAPEGWIIAGCSFTVNKSSVDVTANGSNVDTEYNQDNLNLTAFTMSVRHSTGGFFDARGNAKFTNFKIKLKNDKVSSMVPVTAKQPTTSTDNYYKVTNAVPTSTAPFLITSIGNDLTFGNSTSAIGITATDGEYWGEVNETNKPYTFTLEGNKIKCNGKYLNASVSGSGDNRTAQLSFADRSSTTWSISKSNAGYTISYRYSTGLFSSITFYLTSPSSAGEAFTLTKEESKTIQIFNRAVKPLVFNIKADYATLYCEDAYEMPGTDLVGYFIEDAQKTGDLTPIKRYRSGSVVPAKTSLLLTGTQGAYKAIRYVENADGEKLTPNYSDANLNQLEGHRGNNNTTATERDYDVYYYKLAWNDSHTKLGFFWGAPEGGPFQMSNDYAAYLTVSKQAEARGFNLPSLDELDDDVISSIGISTVESRNENDALYTISGIRVNDTTNLPSGIYIRNGKKIVIR